MTPSLIAQPFDLAEWYHILSRYGMFCLCSIHILLLIWSGGLGAGWKDYEQVLMLQLVCMSGVAEQSNECANV